MGFSISAVLVVDDDPLIVRYLTQLFQHLGVKQVFSAGDGAEALQVYQQVDGKLDAIVVDLMMPTMDGLACLRALAGKQYTGSVIVLSGLDRRILSSAMEIADAHNLNLIGSLTKPLEPFQVELVYQRIGLINARRQLRSSLMERQALLKAIQGKTVEPYFQPIIDCRDQQVFAIESLMRIQDPANNVHEPAEFLSVAEEGGLMMPLTIAMIGKTLAQYRLLLDEGYGFRLTINIAPSLLLNLELPDRLEAMLEAQAIRPGQVLIEVIETSVILATPELLEVLARLRLKGFDLAMDDFGTGFSSIRQLKDLPFNVIKIDRCFIHGIARDEVAKSIVQSVLGMTRDLGFTAIAEGVEREEDEKVLQAMGANYLQGYLHCRPKPFYALRAWLGKTGLPEDERLLGRR